VNDNRDVILGKPWRETSNMVSTTTTGSLNLFYGDVNQAYRVVDRIGLNVVSVPAVGSSGRRPTGQSWIVAWARVGGGVVVDNAGRLLKIR